MERELGRLDVMGAVAGQKLADGRGKLVAREETPRGQVHGNNLGRGGAVAGRNVEEDDDGGVDVLEQSLQAVALVAEIALLPADRLGPVAGRRDQQAEGGDLPHAPVYVAFSPRHRAR